MKTKDFDLILEDVLVSTKKVLGSKAKEYASESDRLHNFKLAAAIDNETPERALWGMAKKHLVSIVDLISSIDVGFVASPEYAREKLGDMRNYLILLEALLIERFENESTIRTTTTTGDETGSEGTSSLGKHSEGPKRYCANSREFIPIQFARYNPTTGQYEDIRKERFSGIEEGGGEE